MATEKVARDNARNKYYNVVKELLTNVGEDVVEVATNKLAFPIVDELGNEQSIVITISVPTGARDGSGYDCYAEAEAYKVERAERESKAKAKAEAKAKRVKA